MLKSFQNILLEKKYFTKEEPLVLAYSGGVDSTTLYHLLKDLNYNIILAHVNHNKRIESQFEQKEIVKMANQDNTIIEIYNYNHEGNSNFHNDAHNKRYSFFIDVCKKYNSKHIITAHHQDDNLETILLNLISGSNLYGYGGISEIMNIFEDINIIRPLLSFSKEEIYSYAHKMNYIYFEDSSNQELDYKRNRIRHKVIPLLKEETNDILKKSAQYSNILKESFQYIRNESLIYLTNNKIKINTFKNLKLPIQKDILCLLLENYNLNKNENIIMDLLNISLNEKPQADYNLSNNYIFKKRYDSIYIEKKDIIDNYSYLLNENNTIYIRNRYKIYFSKNKPANCAKFISLCYNKITFPLLIRNRLNEDVIKMSYGHKKVKNLFIDLKLTKEKRDLIPLVFNNNELIWIIDYAKSEFVYSQKNCGDLYLICEEL